MATSSFLKEVKISNDADAKRLLNTLETAEKNRGRHAIVSMPYSNASKEEIHKMFLGADERI